MPRTCSRSRAGGTPAERPARSRIVYYAPMPKSHRYERLPDDVLAPTRPIRDVPIDVQAGHMRELRGAQNQIADGHAVRDGLMHAWALSSTLSRHDMAVATGLAKSRVDQLIREAAERQVATWNAVARERVARHMPSPECSPQAA